jgi:hypothetical protein
MENKIHSEQILKVFGAITISISVLLTVIDAPAQISAASWSQIITSGRPLSEAAILLQGRFAKPITYEDPIWIWEGDVGSSETVRGLYPKNRSFSLPDELSPDYKSELDLALMLKIVAAYHDQTDGPRFRILPSRWGFHIVPLEVRDITGRRVSVTPLLETQIDIPVENRTPSMHFEEICDALTRASRIKIIAGAPWLDQVFEPNGIIPPRSRALTREEERQVSFPWGTNAVAREALIDLIELSAATLSWNVRCSAEPWDRNCVLNLNPIQIPVKMQDGTTVMKAITGDRRRRDPILLKANLWPRLMH